MKYNFDQSIGRITPIVSKKLGKTIVEKFNNSGYQITSDEWTIIAYLARFDIQNQNELADVIGKDKVAVTRYISGLELMGYVEREMSETDKRANSVYLTKDGKSLYNTLTKLVEDVLNEAFEGISKKDLKITLEVLNKIISNL